MELPNLISLNLTFNNVDASSKKRVLDYIAEYVHAEYPELSELSIFNGLIQRERLGSTGIGAGIGIPHCRVENCPTMIVVVLKLANPIDFDAIDGEPVDLIFALIVPTESSQAHLDTLSDIAELLSQPELLKQLRSTQAKKELYDTLILKAEASSEKT